MNPEPEKIFDGFLKRFNQRRWDALRTTWPRFITNIVVPGGTAPTSTLSALLDEGGVLTELPAKGKLTEVSHPRSEVPELVLREAIFWMHKALHVLGAAEAHVNCGLPTWSLSAAYQSGYFAARSILGFLGVALGETQRTTIVVDLCRDMQGLRPARLNAMGAFGENICFRSIGVLFDHWQVWMLFQRALRVTSCRAWPEGCANYFAQLSVGELTKQRHGLHYQLDYWVMNDLHDFVHSEDFSDVHPTQQGRDMLNSEQNNFSLAFGTLLTRMALQLFDDLSTLTNRLADERAKVVGGISQERHPVFIDTLREEMRGTAV